ncbi:MAG: hypothetical protein BWX83_00876 [Candidatus Cloacimonetes bacterium ADurb.Bin117]|nr:MAG: hypothetical protein BWX83_00876 [Candidatus Cloacimonetes bacterium ADurb.Bin117]
MFFPALHHILDAHDDLGQAGLVVSTQNGGPVCVDAARGDQGLNAEAWFHGIRVGAEKDGFLVCPTRDQGMQVTRVASSEGVGVVFKNLRSQSGQIGFQAIDHGAFIT